VIINKKKKRYSYFTKRKLKGFCRKKTPHKKDVLAACQFSQKQKRWGNEGAVGVLTHPKNRSGKAKKGGAGPRSTDDQQKKWAQDNKLPNPHMKFSCRT